MGLGDFDYKEIVDDTMGHGELWVSPIKEEPVKAFSLIGASPFSAKAPSITTSPDIRPAIVSGGAVVSPFPLIESNMPFPTVKLPEPAKEVSEQILSKEIVNDALKKTGEIGISLVGKMMVSGVVPLTTLTPQVISEAMTATKMPTKVKQFIKSKEIKKVEFKNYSHPILRYMKG